MIPLRQLIDLSVGYVQEYIIQQSTYSIRSYI